jgi:Tol biopolymer transport system component
MKKLILLTLLIIFIPKQLLAQTSFSFNYPICPPNSSGCRDAQDFGKSNSSFGGKYHLGEDWNKGAGEDDANESVHSIASGEVRYSKDSGQAWGRVVIIQHKLPDNSYIYSMYGHLNSKDAIIEGSFVNIGDIIGTIRPGVNKPFKMSAHLHFEIRTDSNPDKLKPGLGYSVKPKPSGWVDPSEFIDSHRQIISPPAAVTSSISQKSHNLATISWTKNNSQHFLSYKIYKLISKTDENPVLLSDIKDEQILEYTDNNLKQDTEYFYKVDVCNIANQCAPSNIVSTKTEKDSNYIGKVVYSSKIGNFFQIHLMGGIKENIKQLRQSKSNDYNSKWSPDGKRILFDSTDLETNTRQVFVMDADGSNQKKVTSLRYFANQADWFSDGSKIVFRGNGLDGIGIYTQNLDGTDLKMVTPKDVPDSPFSLNSYNPAVLEDGQAIIFEATYRYGALRGKGGLFAISVDGKVLIQLLDSLDSSPDVSSSGEIVFSSNKEESNNLFWSIYYSNNKLKNIYKVTLGAPSTAEDPSFSNDGKKIVYSYKNNAKTSEDFELVVVDKESGEKTTLTDNNVDDIDADIFIE